jgi:AcrR family transcriptional regulator
MLSCSYTEEELIEAFWRLYAKKGIDEISVVELVETAGYNRGTFYLHFQSVYNLLEIEEDRLLSEMEECVTYCSKNLGKEDPSSLMMLVLNYYEQNKEKLLILLGERGDIRFMHNLRGMMKRIPIWKVSDPSLGLSDSETSILLDTTVAAVVSLIISWMKEPRDIPADKVLHMIYDIAIKR